MASSRTAARRRRAKAIARDSARPRLAPATTPGEDVDDAGDVWYVPATRWPSVAGILLCLAGLGVAAYETLAHYDTKITLACPDKGFINCAQVTTSQYSEILGIPVAVLGLVYFAAMLPLQLPVAWRSAHPWVRIARVGGSLVGLGMVIWLIYAELFLIGKICIYCTAVHALTFVLFVTVVFGTISTSPELAD